MSAFPSRVTLGRSGLSVCPLAVSGGYGVDARSLRRAFDRGVNFWYHGSFEKPGMTQAIRELCAAGKRDELVIELQAYIRWPWWIERVLTRGLKDLGIDHADVLLLGWFNHLPGQAILERAERLRERGLYRHLAISGHNRPSVTRLGKAGMAGSVALHTRRVTLPQPLTRSRRLLGCIEPGLAVLPGRSAR